MSTAQELKELQAQEYKEGFVTEVEQEYVPKGLNEDIIRLISAKKQEPQWLLSNLGLKIRASALTPQMKIDDGWWQYSYDGGASWTRLCAATGEPGKSVFKNISVSDYFVTFTLASNSMFLCMASLTLS